MNFKVGDQIRFVFYIFTVVEDTGSHLVIKVNCNGTKWSGTQEHPYSFFEGMRLITKLEKALL